MKVIKPTKVTDGTFSRASAATYVNSAGVMALAGVNVPRITFDPVTKVCQGIMVELASTNLKAHSSDFTDASWPTYGGSVTPNLVAAPDGTTAMDRWVEDSAGGTHELYADGLTITSGLTYTWSVFVKDYSGDRALRLLPGTSCFLSSSDIVFDLQNGVVTSVGSTVVSHSVVDYGQGIFRVSVSAVATASVVAGMAGVVLQPMSGGSTSYTGNGTSGFYLWGAQYEQGALSSYIPTAGVPFSRAEDVTTGVLAYTNLVDADPNFDIATHYTLNQRVTYECQIWECILHPCLGQVPTISPLYWLNRGPSNKWAALDSQVSTSSTSTQEQIYVLRPGYCSGFGLFGLEGSTVEFSVLSEPGGPLLRSEKILLDGADISNWYQYYFAEAEQKTDLVVADLSLYNLSYLTIRISGPATVKCGHLSVGKVVDLGGSQYGASIGITDYSTKKTDANGATTFVEKGYSKDLNVSTLFSKGQLNSVYQTLSSLRATPCTWIVADEGEYAALTTFGNIRDFSIDVEYYDTSLCSFDIQGLST